jgi:ketosteroid isomerase-like protein
MSFYLAIWLLGGVQNAPLPEAGKAGEAAVDRKAHGIASDFYRRWFAAVESGNSDATIKLLAPGFVLKPPLGPPVSDAVAFRNALTAMHARVRQEVEWRIEDAAVHGGWAWVRITEKARHIPRAGGEPAVLTGSHLAILKRAGGEWLLHRDQMSLDALPQTAASKR